jgi:hypothetical protein
MGDDVETADAIRSRVTARLLSDGQWTAAEPVRDQLMREARQAGLSKDDAKRQAYSALDERFPPRDKSNRGENESRGEAGGVDYPTARNNVAGVQSPAHATEAAVTGLSDVPSEWPTLPPNATLAQEIQWVQANRLSVVRDLGDRAIVDLSKAMSPAPSWAALGWLETSIRAYAKFVDVAAKASAHVEDERDMVRRERLAIDEIRGLLAEMLPDR